jgi:hypothetical protein
MLGQGPQDEDLPPDDDDFDPNAFLYHGFGQFGQGPPPPPPNLPAPFILEHLQAMGWQAWPLQPVQGQDLNNDVEEPPLVPLVPMNPPDVQPIQNQAQDNVILPAVDEIVQAQGPEVIAVDNENIAEEQVLAMDDVIDSDEDIPPPLLFHLWLK